MEKRKMFPLNLVGLLAIAMIALVTGCGGMSNSILPADPFIGNYTGTYTLTSGPDVGETGSFSFNIAASGVIQGNVVSTSGIKNATLFGTMSSADTFVLNSIFYTSGTSGQGSGALDRSGNSSIASGTFTLTDGNHGTFFCNK